MEHLQLYSPSLTRLTTLFAKSHQTLQLSAQPNTLILLKLDETFLFYNDMESLNEIRQEEEEEEWEKIIFEKIRED